MIDDQSSGSANFLPKIQVELLDGLNQRITAGIADSAFTVRVESIDPQNDISIASRQVLAEAFEGVATFETLALSAPSGTYELVFSVDSDIVLSAKANVTLRDCVFGERYNPAGYVCELCPFGTFTLYKDVPSCEACPTHALCSGNASWIPSDGFWHSSPLSVVMFECPQRESCRYQNRTEVLESRRKTRLEAFLQRFVEMDSPQFTNAEYPQCEMGYEGPLCGSCEPGYGHTNAKTCVHCRNRGSSFAVVLVLAMWQMFLVAFTIRIALVSIKDMRTNGSSFKTNNSLFLCSCGSQVHPHFQFSV